MAKRQSRTKQIVKWIAATLSPLVVGVIWYGLSEPNLVFVGPIPPRAPVIEGRNDRELFLIHTRTDTTFRNWGLKSGHIEDMKIVPVGITPQPVEGKWNCDQTAIRPLSAKEIRCDFWIWIDPRKPPFKGGVLEFRTIFYAAGGKAIHTEAGIRIERTL